MCEGDCLNIHLGTDASTKITTHTNELFARLGILIFIWIIASIPWLLNVDEVLSYFVGLLDPCDSDCLNLYQPEKWSEIRWLVSGFLGLITVLPLVNRQIWLFSRPALTTSERKMLMLILITAPVLFVIITYVSVVKLLPLAYGFGHEIHDSYGFVTKYDAVSMINFAMLLLWVQTLVLLSCIVMITGGLTGNLDSTNANWWRLRVYGFMALISILSHYDRTSHGLTITIFSLAFVELIARPWTTKTPKFQVTLRETFNAEGEIVSVLDLLCGCTSTNQNVSNDFTVMENVCSNETTQDDLLKLIINHGPSKVIVHCCDTTLPWKNQDLARQDIEITLNQNQKPTR